MKQRKKSIRVLFFMLLLLVAVTSYVSADDTKVIKVNTSVTGQAAERQANIYQFNLTSSGKVNLQLKHENLYDTNIYWTVQLLADDLETVLQTYNSAGTDTSLTGGSIGLTKGTYYVKVYARKECSHEYAEKPYTLKVKYQKSSKWEIEYNASKKQGNNSQATATSLKAGSFSYGTICSSSDVDFFKLKIKSAGTLSMDFRHPNVYSSDTYWKVQLVNEKTNVIYEFDSAGTKTKKTTAKIGVSAGTYYVKITGGGSKWSDKDYKIRLLYTKSSKWEKEYTTKTSHFNNSMSTANKISRGKTYSGTISSKTDVDYLKFTVPSTRTVTIKFSHNYKPRKAKWWKISVYNSRTTEIYSFYSRGIDKSLTKKIRLSKGTYFIKISQGTSWTGRAYKIYVK